MLFFIKKRIFHVVIIISVFLSISVNNIYAADIILDPGHSPGKSGAASCTGEKEYKYNDDLVKHIKEELDKHGIDNQLSRLPAQNKSLIARTKNTKDAKLFLSVHHDSVQPQFVKFSNGNPISDKAEGYSLFVSRKNPHFDKSVEYARSISENLYSRGLRPSRHHGEKIRGENRELLDEKLGIYAFDDLIVLKTSQCPAVLLEAGVLVHPADEKRVKTEEFKAAVSQSILKAVDSI